uniref:Photosystem II protein N n=1 Tax=Guillardia theta TaxID=55529 RepID=A0A0U2I051_GUITH|nr:photosystem II protein N [Guillardia theta]
MQRMIFRIHTIMLVKFIRSKTLISRLYIINIFFLLLYKSRERWPSGLRRSTGTAV